MRHTHRRGFTFIELLTAVSIIAVLAAILFPVFARAREKARQAACINNLHNIGMAMRVYSAEHFGHFPPTNNDLWPLVPKYLPDAEAFVCPSAAGAAEATSLLGGHVPPEVTAGVGEPGRPCNYVYLSGLCDDEYHGLAIAGDDERNRHNDGANYLFLDGHVKWVKGGGGYPGAPPGFGPSAPAYEPDPEIAELDKLRPEPAQGEPE